MSIDSTITEQIVVRLQEYLSDPAHDALNLRQLATRFEALPLCVDWEKCWALRPDGQVVVFLHEGEDPQLHTEEDVRMRNVALFQGSLTYSEIQSLVPDRPADADDCPFCAAKGFASERPESQNIICYCGGLGWVPAKT